MNWNSPVAEEPLFLALGLRFDSRSAVLSRYSKPAPVARAASRIAPVTRVATSAVAPLMRVAMSIAASVPMGAPWPAGLPYFPRRVAGWGGYGKRRVNRNPGRPGGLQGADDNHTKPARRHVLRGFRGRPPLSAHAAAHRDADGQHVVLQHDAQPAAAAHRPRVLREGDRLGPAADEFAVHARSHGRDSSL